MESWAAGPQDRVRKHPIWLAQVGWQVHKAQLELIDPIERQDPVTVFPMFKVTFSVWAQSLCGMLICFAGNLLISSSKAESNFGFCLFTLGKRDSYAVLVSAYIPDTLPRCLCSFYPYSPHKTWLWILAVSSTELKNKWTNNNLTIPDALKMSLLYLSIIFSGFVLN